LNEAAIRRIVLLGLALGCARVGGAQSATTVAKKAGSAIERAAAARNRKKVTDRYDPVFRKYTKRYFGPMFDWRYFKAQGLAESGLDSTATSWVGARGVMQLMPSTYREIASRRPDFGRIDQPEWNIAAGIMHDRYLWTLYQKDVSDDERHRFMFASYNAGEGTIMNAQRACVQRSLDRRAWRSVETVAPEVPRWRYRETLGYVRKIQSGMSSLDDKGRVKR
jgi:membrane-bound lytic murein transglycosylase F